MTTQLKNLVKLKKAERSNLTKIEHPLAKYNNIGQLLCILCKVIIKSDALWTPHCVTSGHKNNLVTLQKQQQLQQQQQHQQSLKRKRIDEEQAALKKVKIDNDFFEENTFKTASTIISPITPSKSDQVIQPKVVQSDIPDGFFDDFSQQAHAQAISSAKQVQGVATYSNQDEIDEEMALLKTLDEKKLKLQIDPFNIEEEFNIDDIVEVEDFSAYDFNDIDKIMLEPVIMEKKSQKELILEEFSHKPEIIEDTTQDKIENEILKDVLSRREVFEKMTLLKEKAKESRLKSNGNTIQKEKNKKKGKKNISQDEVEEFDLLELDFWRSQGL